MQNDFLKSIKTENTKLVTNRHSQIINLFHYVIHTIDSVAELICSIIIIIGYTVLFRCE